jgi:hypothetical protein
VHSTSAAVRALARARDAKARGGWRCQRRPNERTTHQRAEEYARGMDSNADGVMKGSDTDDPRPVGAFSLPSLPPARLTANGDMRRCLAGLGSTTLRDNERPGREKSRMVLDVDRGFSGPS